VSDAPYNLRGQRILLCVCGGIAAYKAINTLDSMIGHRDDRQHFRVVFLPRVDALEDAIGRLERFLTTWRS
jgi:hypothetical protein